MRRMFKLCLYFLFLLLLIAPQAFSQEPPGLPPVVRFGFIGPLSGDAAHYGNDERNVIALAPDEINSQNLLNGSKLEVIYEDGKCTGKDAAIAAEKLVSIDKVKVILGGICSGETLGAGPIAQKGKVILYSVFSSNPDISKIGDFVFRSVPTDSVGGQKLAGAVIKDGYRRVAIISEINDYAQKFKSIAAQALTAGGAQVVADESYNPPETDFRSLLLRMRAKKPSAIILNPNDGLKGGLIVRQLLELGWKVPFYGTFVFASADSWSAAGGIQKLEGMKFVDGPAIRSKKGRAFIERFKARFPAPHTEFEIVLRYESVYLLVEAIKKAGIAPENIRDYLRQLPVYQGMEYAYHFDKRGDVIGVPYVLKQIKGGQVIVLE
jgi:branched-chain amino acid transport system substrate-binding protein